MADDKPKRPDMKGKKRKKDEGGSSNVCILVAISLVLVPLVGYIVYYLHWNLVVLPGVVTSPCVLPKVTTPDAFAPEKDPELYWGSYAANLYFGLRTRAPESPQFGVAWFQQPRQDIYMPKIRHWAEQSDGLVYGWHKHDGRWFGIQHVEDGVARLNTTFVKKAGGAYGGDWSARVQAGPRDGVSEEHVLMSVIAYFAIPGNSGTFLHGEIKNDELNPYGFQLKGLHGFTPELGTFRLRFSSRGNIAAKGFAMVTTPGDFSRIKDTLLNNTIITRVKSDQMAHYLCLSGGQPGSSQIPNPNLLAVQITFNGSAQLDVVFESDGVVERTDPVVGQAYDDLLASYAKKFDQKFEDTFELKGRGKYADVYVNMAKYAVSNMVGSVSYFYGSNVVQSKHCRGPVPYGPHRLFSAMPCRPFFPRGFLWDEGFHHLLLRLWDPHVSLQGLGTWLDLMNIEGWIPRENILGTAAAMKVPAEFVVQHNDIANPPMFFFLLAKYATNPAVLEKHKDFFVRAYPRLRLWYSWLNQSQAGPLPGTYRWRGRNATTQMELNPKTLASGFDDYPRASHPSPAEYHLDLYCWMAVASRLMRDLSRQFDATPDPAYARHAEFMLDPKTLDALHYSPKTKRYCDYGLHTRNVKLERTKVPPELAARGVLGHMYRAVRSEPKLRLVSDTFGYVSLFPLMFRLLDPESPRIGPLLADLTNPDLLWSDYGLRSLAKLSPLYNQRNTEHDPPYWRGSVWMNMNYLVLEALAHYSRVEGPHRDTAHKIYAQLRANLVGNLMRQYADTGFIWEHYNDLTGEGEGAHPFTGWSSLIVLIMAEKYD